MGLGCEWRHARKWWAGNFGDFWKKQSVEIWLWARPVEIELWARIWDLNLDEGSPTGGATGCAARLLGQMEQSA